MGQGDILKFLAKQKQPVRSCEIKDGLEIGSVNTGLRKLMDQGYVSFICFSRFRYYFLTEKTEQMGINKKGINKFPSSFYDELKLQSLRKHDLIEIETSKPKTI